MVRNRWGLVAAVAAAVLATACGAPGPPRGPARTLVWEDDFDGPAGSPPDPARWTAELGGGGWGNEELQTYTDDPANLALDGGGNLLITAVGSAAGNGERAWTSARITTLDKAHFRYGRIEVRARVPAGRGLWAAGWTLGTNIREVGWPACGEIDVVEALGGTPRESLHALHAPWPGHRDWTWTGRLRHGEPLSEAFHVYSAEWTPERISFAVDDREVGSVSPADVPAGASWPFDGEQYLLLNLAVGGRLPGMPDASTPDRASYVVDSVRVYAPR